MAEHTRNHSLEDQLQNIRSEIEQKKQELTPEQLESEPTSEKTILHNVVGEKLGKLSPSPPGIAQGNNQPAPKSQIDTPSYKLPKLKGNVEQLVSIAFQKDIDTAIKEAKRSNDAALIDAFHDALVDELYDRLVSEDKLKKLE